MLLSKLYYQRKQFFSDNGTELYKQILIQIKFFIRKTFTIKK